MVKKIALMFCIVSLSLFAESINGEYGVTGFNPHTREPYHGKALIKENGDIMDITWHLRPDGTVYQGTGIRRGNTVSVIFRNVSNPTDVGVQSYNVQDDGTLAGKWIYFGRNRKGSETLKPMY